MTRQDAIEVLAVVAATWSGSAAVKSPQLAAQIWEGALGHLDRKTVDRALGRAISSEEFAPSPATILRIVRQMNDVGPVNRPDVPLPVVALGPDRTPK